MVDELDVVDRFDVDRWECHSDEEGERASPPVCLVGPAPELLALEPEMLAFAPRAELLPEASAPPDNEAGGSPLVEDRDESALSNWWFKLDSVLDFLRPNMAPAPACGGGLESKFSDEIRSDPVPLATEREEE